MIQKTALLLFISAFIRISASAAPGSDLEVIRGRIIADLLEPAVNETEIRNLVATIQPDGSWATINYKDVSRTGFQHSEHLNNMLALSRALKKKDSPYYNSEEVRKAAHAALDFWIDHDFICDNWWWNEMGTPNWMINTLLVLDTDLTEKQKTEGARIAGRANLETFGARPGGDLIQIAGMLGKQALFRRDEATLERVVSVMGSQIQITLDRGIKPDLSFHHRTDHVISTLTYGTGYANAFAYWAVKIAGTRFKFPDASMHLLIDYYLDGICKSHAFATYPDPGARNRDMSRRGSEHAGNALAQNLLVASDYRKAELENIIRIRKGEKKADLTWDRFFWHSEYFTHQRPGWFASVRMHSSRNFTMEQPHNEEGLKMHHVGDGSNFVMITGKEYEEIFPVWDWQKIPGTTTVQRAEHLPWKDIAKKGLTDFVGGVSDGTYGAVAFDFSSTWYPLKARKSWFFFDNEYVCLGAGIASEAEEPVFTTLNQSLLTSEVTVKAKNAITKPEKGEHSLQDVSWIHHAGIAYLFPEPVSVHVSNTMATGNYRSINHQAWATDEPVQKETFTAWIDHGKKPQQAQYAYIVIPSGESASVDAYKRSDISILSNTPELQAVAGKTLNRTDIIFYSPGKIKLTNGIRLQAESPCMVMVKTNGKSVEKIAVSDPTHKLSSLQLKLSAPVNGGGAGWKGEWNKKEKVSTLTITLPAEGYAGQSVVIDLP